MSTDVAGPDGSALSEGLGHIADLVACLRDDSGRHINGLYDKRAADELERLAELADSEGTRAVSYLRRARKVEAEVALLRAALNGGNVIERLQFALQRLADAADCVGVKHFDTDWLSDEVQELQAATHAARLVLGPNAKVTGLAATKATMNTKQRRPRSG
jgi:hypothetical protein